MHHPLFSFAKETLVTHEIKIFIQTARMDARVAGNRMKRIIFSFLLPFLAAASPAVSEVPQHIDVGSLPGQATMVDHVVVPVPSEIFGVLDKLGSPNWHEVLRSEKVSPAGDRAQVALLLGTVIAEGFIAVEAQEGEEVKKIGRSVLNLAGAMGVRKSVTARSNAIIECADKKEWEKVRNELDRALQDVKQAMTELHDDQLAHLVSLGGWLRGTEALTVVVGRNYSKDAAELLHQPALLDFFQRRLDEMPPRLKSNRTVGQIQRQLMEIKPLIDTASPDISVKSVEKVRHITEELVKLITAKNT
jgi:hypothetical protein